MGRGPVWHATRFKVKVCEDDLLAAGRAAAALRALSASAIIGWVSVGAPGASSLPVRLDCAEAGTAALLSATCFGVTFPSTDVGNDGQSRATSPGEESAVFVSAVEAYFLAAEYECLQLRSIADLAQALTAAECWTVFTSIRTNFAVEYAAYKQFRLQGWLPRQGMLYGCDYVLYRHHPSIAHSDYCAVAVTRAAPHQQLTWRSVQCLSRVSGQVAKGLLLVYVQPKQPQIDWTSPSCLNKLSVEFVSVARWDPTAGREAKHASQCSWQPASALSAKQADSPEQRWTWRWECVQGPDLPTGVLATAG
eukprot:jgi/Chlat1/4456/Chrsp29S04564